MHWAAGLALGLIGVAVVSGVFYVESALKGRAGVYAVDIESRVTNELGETTYDLSDSTTLEEVQTNGVEMISGQTINFTMATSAQGYEL